MANPSLESLFVPTQHPKRRYRHGHKTATGCSPEWATYQGMIARCKNPQNPNYIRYGARGIRVCDRWRDDFVNFLADMGRSPGPGYSLERIDNDGDYTPENCRWATVKEQSRNRRNSKRITYQGVTLTQAEWAERIGIDQGTLHSRLKCGWTVERALTQPLRKISKRNTCF